MPRKNPAWERAHEIASDMGNTTDANIKRILKELKEVRPDATALGFDDSDVIACWKWLRTRDDFPIEQARITTVLRGSPTYLQQWAQEILDNLPSVVFVADYDDYLRRNAPFFAKRHFVYRYPSPESQFDGSRMTYAEAQRLGLTEESNAD